VKRKLRGIERRDGAVGAGGAAFDEMHTRAGDTHDRCNGVNEALKPAWPNGSERAEAVSFHAQKQAAKPFARRREHSACAQRRPSFVLQAGACQALRAANPHLSA